MQADFSRNVETTSPAALLAHQGLRATKVGGHIAVFDAVQFQFNGPHGSQSFAKLHYFRRLRGGAEYPTEDTPPTMSEDADYCLDRADAVHAEGIETPAFRQTRCV